MSAPSPPPVEPLIPRTRPGVAPRRRLLAPSRDRRMPTERQLIRRRFVMRWIKRLLPIGAVALLAAVALWPEIERAEDRGRVSFRRVVQSGPEQVRVIEPRYQGLDDQSRPYNVTAALARQAGSAEVIELDRPRADMLLSDGGWVLLESRDGRYDRGQNRLDLAGDVTLWHDNGSVLVTGTAAIELGAGSAQGDSPVAAQGPFGTLTSEGFRLSERGQVVVFTGRSRLMLEGGS